MLDNIKTEGLGPTLTKVFAKLDTPIPLGYSADGIVAEARVSRDTSRIDWAKLMARAGEEFPLERPGVGGDIRLIAFITEPALIADRRLLGISK